MEALLGSALSLIMTVVDVYRRARAAKEQEHQAIIAEFDAMKGRLEATWLSTKAEIAAEDKKIDERLDSLGGVGSEDAEKENP